LYILYTNELAEVTGEKTVLHADDATLVFADDCLDSMGLKH